MWAATILTSAASAFGRLVSVNLMPCALVVYSILVSLHGLAVDSGEALSAKEVFLYSGKIDSLPLLLAILLVAALVVLTQTFQYGIVRLFEGYWQRYPVLAAAAHRGKIRQQKRLDRRRQELRSYHRMDLERPQRQAGLSSMGARRQRRLQAEERRVAAAGIRADDELSANFPPDGDELLPTQLGNAMRAFERRAGERYGYDTIATWPRLYPYVSDRLIAAFHAATDALHAAINFTVSFLVAAIVLFVSFVDDFPFMLLSLFSLAAGYFSYRGSVAAARSVGLTALVAFDLHRFEMLEGLDLPLPPNGEEEYQSALVLSSLFRPSDLKEAIDRAKESWYMR